MAGSRALGMAMGVFALLAGMAFGAEGSGTTKAKLALDGNCPVCAVGGKTVKGKPEFKSVFQGLEYRFPSEEIKGKFDADPEKYAAQDMGFCKVCAVDMGKEVKGDPAIYAVHGGKIFLFVNDDARKKFLANPERYLRDNGKKEEGSGHKAPPREGS